MKPHLTEKQAAWQSGYDAAYAGKPAESNPHGFDELALAMQWTTGYNCGDFDKRRYASSPLISRHTK